MKSEDEATRFQNNYDEHTTFESTAPIDEEVVEDTPETDVDDQPDEKGSSWKRVAAGAGVGVLIGSLGTTLMGMANPDSTEESSNAHARESLSHPEWVVDDDIAIATNVNDNMSFAQAFATARAEVGAGGCFEWHGKLYGTYYAEEWNHMSAAEKAQYGSHFSWNHIDRSGSHVAHHTHTSDDSETAEARAMDPGDDEASVVSVNHPGEGGDDEEAGQNMAMAGDDEVDVYAVDHEVEILGVDHDYNSDADVASVAVDDGQDVILIDMDTDGQYDLAADMHDQSPDTHDFADFTAPDTDFGASIDYSTDDMYEG